MVFRRRVAAIACLIAASGCSWVTVQAPPRGPIARDQVIECTTSVAPPVVDTTLGAAALGLGGAAAVGGAAGLGTCDPATCWIGGPIAVAYLTMGVVLLGVAVAEGISAAHGYSTTAECRDVKSMQLACVSGVEPSCTALKERGASR